MLNAVLECIEEDRYVILLSKTVLPLDCYQITFINIGPNSTSSRVHAGYFPTCSTLLNVADALFKPNNGLI